MQNPSNETHKPCYSCGIYTVKDNVFSVYFKSFCSMNCLLPYKLEMDEKEKNKESSKKSFRKPDMGGSACF